MRHHASKTLALAALLLPLAAIGCAEQYYPEYVGGYCGSYPAYASGHGYRDDYYGRPYAGGENCGTPDQPKACPPLPRTPLRYYPGDRW